MNEDKISIIQSLPYLKDTTLCDLANGGFLLAFVKSPKDERTKMMQVIKDSVEGEDVLAVSFCDCACDLILSIYERSSISWKKKYEHPQLLIINDFHELMGKESTQMEFLWLIQNRMKFNKATILLSALSISDIQPEFLDELIHLISMNYRKE